MFFTAINLFMLVIGGGMSSETTCAATTQRQAKQALDYAKTIIRNSPELKKRIQIKRDEIIFDDGFSTCTMVKSSEQQAVTLDGAAISSAIIDEYHAYNNNDLLKVIQTSMGKRFEPLLLICTTAGFHTVGYPLYERLLLTDNVLDGKKDEDSTLYAIFQNESEEEVLTGDIEVLRKSNPSLGEAVDIDWLKSERENAKLLPSSWKHFLVKHANIFQATADDPFISLEDWANCEVDIPYKELKGGRCWVGIDLSTKIDLTSYVLIIEHPLTKKLFILPRHYIPDGEKNETLQVRANGVDLTDWLNDGYITKHKDRIDFDKVYQDILSDIKNYDVQSIGYDPYHAWDLINKLENNLNLAAIPLTPVSQIITVLSTPSKYFEELVLTKNIGLEKNPVYAYCNSNARVKYSQTSSLIRVVKDKQLNPIDSIMATITGLTTYMQQEYNNIELTNE